MKRIYEMVCIFKVKIFRKILLKIYILHLVAVNSLNVTFEKCIVPVHFIFAVRLITISSCI